MWEGRCLGLQTRRPRAGSAGVRGQDRPPRPGPQLLPETSVQTSVPALCTPPAGARPLPPSLPCPFEPRARLLAGHWEQAPRSAHGVFAEVGG